MAALAPACSVETMTEEEALGEIEQGACNAQEGANVVMAELAVQVAKELGTLNPKTDLVVNYAAEAGKDTIPDPSRGGYGSTAFYWWQPYHRLELTAAGKAKCSGGNCEGVQLLLDLQSDQMNDVVKFPNVSGQNSLNTGGLRSKLVSNYEAQTQCQNYPELCAAPGHKLALVSSGPGICALNFKFKATYWNQPGKTNGSNLTSSDAAKLKTQLIWAGEAGGQYGGTLNEFIAFSSFGNEVTIDPPVFAELPPLPDYSPAALNDAEIEYPDKPNGGAPGLASGQPRDITGADCTYSPQPTWKKMKRYNTDPASAYYNFFVCRPPA
jgi:hypothetical protein